MIRVANRSLGLRTILLRARSDPSIFEGSMLNLTENLSSNASSRNISNGIVGAITSELPTLGLPSIVMATLANPTIPSNGSYGPPQYNASQASPSRWQFWGEQLWNTITGAATWVVDGVTHIASAIWSLSTGSEAYLGGALAGALTRATQGLASLRNQAGATLKKVRAAMANALESGAEWVVRNLLEGPLNSLLNDSKGYAQRLATDLGNGAVASFWSDFDGNFFWDASGFSIAITVALGILEGLTLGTAQIIALIVGLIIGACALVFANQLADFSGDSPFSTAVVTELDKVFGITSSDGAIATYMSDASSIVGVVSANAATAFIVNSVVGGDKVGWTDAAGLTLAIVSVFVAGVAHETLNSGEAYAVSLLFDGASLGVDSVAFQGHAFDDEDMLTAGLDIGATAIDLTALGLSAHW
jgi:hypothetical protein